MCLPASPVQVATQRVRTAAKKAIPHLADPVSKLASVGAATQASGGPRQG